ncbi:MAG: preprotein translocase subunit YajC [Betaproteobacteria bacterium]|nr:preprotein translocase subunit YajC [Betaproteobacteria bacterium]
MFGKLIFFVIIALLIYWIIKSRQPEDTETDSPSEAIEDMVRCTHCGVHLPKSESIASDDLFFCSDEHRHQHLEASE